MKPLSSDEEIRWQALQYGEAVLKEKDLERKVKRQGRSPGVRKGPGLQRLLVLEALWYKAQHDTDVLRVKLMRISVKAAEQRRTWRKEADIPWG